VRLFLGVHLRDLALRGAMDARIRPAGLPAVEIGLRGGDRLEAQAFEGRLLGMADARFDLAFAIGVPGAARQGHHAVVREDIAVQRIQRRVPDVGRQDALFEIVEDDDLHRAAEPTEGRFVERRPDLRARPPRQQPHRFA
jgi:hypothetical protein